jgi:hypothetical protein
VQVKERLKAAEEEADGPAAEGLVSPTRGGGGGGGKPPTSLQTSGPVAKWKARAEEVSFRVSGFRVRV